MSEETTVTEEIEELFNNSTSEKQWTWVINIGTDPIYSDNLELCITEEYTEVIIIDEGHEIRMKMKETIGNEPGIKHLLNRLNIKHKFLT